MTDLTPDPVVAPDRLAEIADLDLFTAEVEAKMDDLARRAAERFDLPIGLITVLLNDAQYFAGTHGLTGWMAEARGTPIEWSICATAVRTGEPFVVPDANAHPLTKTNPLVTMDGVQSYAGSPLITSKGYVLGTCCVIGDKPREFTPDEIAELSQMADEVVAEIEATRRTL